VPIVRDSILIRQPRERIFARSQDYAERLEWDPFLREMRFLDGMTTPGTGLKVYVKAWNGLTMEVEYITYKPPEVVAMKMLKGPGFFDTFSGTWRFDEVNGTQTLVTFSYSFKSRWRLVRPILDRVIHFAFARDIRKRLTALKQSCEAMQGT
jgi:ribosome-associated toxin RatA of RatAB toxin-antitoxin module